MFHQGARWAGGRGGGVKKLSGKSGMDGEAIFFTGRGGEGQGQKSMGRGEAGNPPLPTVRGGAGKGSKSAGLGVAVAGNILCVLIEIICCSKGNLNLHCIK